MIFCGNFHPVWCQRSCGIWFPGSQFMGLLFVLSILQMLVWRFLFPAWYLPTIEYLCSLDQSWQILLPSLVSWVSICGFLPSSLCLRYYLVSFIQYVFSPQCEFWLLQNSILNRILRYLYWILILDIFKFDPCSTSILPLDADFLSFSCIFLRLVPLLVITNAFLCNVCVLWVLVSMMDLISANMLPS